MIVTSAHPEVIPRNRTTTSRGTWRVWYLFYLYPHFKKTPYRSYHVQVWFWFLKPKRFLNVTNCWTTESELERQSAVVWWGLFYKIYDTPIPGPDPRFGEVFSVFSPCYWGL
jgi:hypothetical protein